MDRVSCALFFSHRQARWLAGLGALDLLLCFIFITLPDNRDPDYPNSELIFGVQMAGAWLNLVLTIGCLVLVWVTYSVPQRKLTFDREARAQYLAIVKFVQLLCDMLLTAFPTTMRQFVALFILTIQIVQIFYALYVVRRARDVFTRRIRPPLVIKALLDMTGERAAEVDPFTLDMLERLEGLVKVRTQMKFSVRSGRQFLVFGVAALLVASLFQYSWEFAKILSYGNRYSRGRKSRRSCPRRICPCIGPRTQPIRRAAAWATHGTTVRAAPAARPPPRVASHATRATRGCTRSPTAASAWCWSSSAA